MVLWQPVVLAAVVVVVYPAAAVTLTGGVDVGCEDEKGEIEMGGDDDDYYGGLHWKVPVFRSEDQFHSCGDSRGEVGREIASSWLPLHHCRLKFGVEM